MLDERQLVATRALGIDAVESIGRSGPGERDPRRTLPAELEHPVAVPAGNEVERLLSRVLDPCTLHVRVEVRHVDEARSVPVGGGCDLTRHLLLAEGGADGDELILLHVGAEDDGELCELGGACGSHADIGWRAARYQPIVAV